MLNQQEISGRWNEIKGVLKKKWSSLTDDDVMSFNCNVDQLIGMIQRKTGESREAIEHFIDQAVEHGQGMLGNARDRASDAMHDGAKYVSDSVQGSAKYVADKVRYGGDRVRQGISSAGDMVHDHPGQSVAAAFGPGLIVGVGAFLLGFPNPAIFGLLAAVLNYIPYVGPAVMVVILFGVGLVTFPSLSHALLAPAAFVALTTAEGHFITPTIVGRSNDTAGLAMGYAHVSASAAALSARSSAYTAAKNPHDPAVSVVTNGACASTLVSKTYRNIARSPTQTPNISRPAKNSISARPAENTSMASRARSNTESALY